MITAFARSQCALQWSSGTTFGDQINDLAARPDGALKVVSQARVLEWDGTAWIPYGPPTSGPSLGLFADGRVLLTGQYTYTSCHPYLGCSTSYYAAHYVTPLGTAALLSFSLGSVTAFAAESLNDGTVVVSWGTVPVPGWPPFRFTSVVSSTPSGASSNSLGFGADALARHPGGGFVAVGPLGSTQQLVHWNGTFTVLGSANFNVPPTKMLALSNGAIVVAGPFSSVGGTPAARIARWQNGTWTGLPGINDGFINDMAELPNGDLVVAGCFSTLGGQMLENIARWNGSSWTPLGSGTNNEVRTLQWMPDGTLWVGGAFTQAGGQPYAFLARLRSPCPAVAASLGGGCAGTGGADELVATTLPWRNAIYRSRVSGLPAQALSLVVYGFSQVNVPLSLISPLAAPGCNLLVTPDVLQVAAGSLGTAEHEIALNNPSLFVGQQIYQQAVALGFDAAGNLSEWSSSNALRLTVGDF